MDTTVLRCQYIASMPPKLNESLPGCALGAFEREEAARRFAKLLIEDFVANGRYGVCTDWRLDVKDESGELLLSIPFRDSSD
jgi:hypothetical protein